MKNVLIITYYFPPSGGPGVQRVLNCVKYLPEYGWNPIVYTVSNGMYPARDESLLGELPKDLVVEKSEIFEPYDFYRKFTGKPKDAAVDVNTIKKEGQQTSFKEKLAEFIRATFFIPDARAFWRLKSPKVLRKLVREHNIKAIYSSSPPYTCSLIARNLKRETGLPWIAGFRDPWTGFISSPKRWFLPKAIDIHYERSVFQEADAVECAWVGIIKDAMGKFPGLRESKFFHVPNGFDADSFPEVPKIQTTKFTITYTGSMYGRRNPEAFFQAINSLVESGKVDPRQIRLRFIGRFGAEVEEMFEKAPFKDSIEIFGYMAHKKSVEYLMKSDALLLVVDESKESEEIVPGKVYEYLGVGRPILAVAPEKSAIADLAAETRAARVAHQSNPDKIAQIFLDYFEAWKSGKSIFEPNTEAVKSYERKSLVGKLANILDIKVKNS